MPKAWLYIHILDGASILTAQCNKHFIHVAYIFKDMWEWFARYPTVRIEDVGTPYVKDIDEEAVVEYDYIIVGGLS